jgi:hypothetical protein
MNIMINRPRKLVLLAVFAAGLLPAAAASAHCCRSSYAEPPPLYHYVVTEAPYDVELTSNVFATPYQLRRFPYVRCLDGCGGRAPLVPERRAVVEDGEGPPISGKARVIRAEAEVTILGPDRMNIRLFRKERGSNVSPDE